MGKKEERTEVTRDLRDLYSPVPRTWRMAASDLRMLFMQSSWLFHRVDTSCSRAQGSSPSGRFMT